LCEDELKNSQASGRLYLKCLIVVVLHSKALLVDLQGFDF
jgi:hypothetical protein